jgi:hypothetical protein
MQSMEDAWRIDMRSKRKGEAAMTALAADPRIQPDPFTVISPSLRRKLRRRACSFCEVRLIEPATGHCGGIYAETHAACGWKAAFRTLGIEEALRQSRLPADQRSKVV